MIDIKTVHIRIEVIVNTDPSTSWRDPYGSASVMLSIPESMLTAGGLHDITKTLMAEAEVNRQDKINNQEEEED